MPIIVPTLLLAEVAAVISRGWEDEDLARGFAAAGERLPHLVWVPLDTTLAQRAIGVAAQFRLRGSNAVYAALALRFGATLVTLDQEQRERLAAVLATRTPAEALTGAASSAGAVRGLPSSRGPPLGPNPQGLQGQVPPLAPPATETDGRYRQRWGP